ncbi:MAG: hypothetical protein LW847_13610 [Burkholderiales bacterium]|nr:hypothetical protein [Burkholderiales bacterium]
MALRANDARCAGYDGGCAAYDGFGVRRFASSARSAIITRGGHHPS